VSDDPLLKQGGCQAHFHWRYKLITHLISNNSRYTYDKKTTIEAIRKLGAAHKLGHPKS
jgi:hypothetical protein